jgi:hypothetical protein
MSSFDAAMDRDGNRQVITSNEAFKLESTWTFAAATTGSVAAHTVFTVTGNVLVQVFGICDTDLTSGGAAKIEMGVTGNTAGLIAQTTATTVDNGDIWVDASAAVGVEALPSTFILNDGLDILLTVSAATVTAGVIDFYCLWRPLSADANITVTTPA